MPNRKIKVTYTLPIPIISDKAHLSYSNIEMLIKTANKLKTNSIFFIGLLPIGSHYALMFKIDIAVVIIIAYSDLVTAKSAT